MSYCTAKVRWKGYAMRHKRVYLIGKAVDGFGRRSGYAIWGERDNFRGPSFAVRFRSEGGELDLVRV